MFTKFILICNYYLNAYYYLFLANTLVTGEEEKEPCRQSVIYKLFIQELVINTKELVCTRQKIQVTFPTRKKRERGSYMPLLAFFLVSVPYMFLLFF